MMLIFLTSVQISLWKAVCQNVLYQTFQANIYTPTRTRTCTRPHFPKWTLTIFFLLLLFYHYQPSTMAEDISAEGLLSTFQKNYSMEILKWAIGVTDLPLTWDNFWCCLFLRYKVSWEASRLKLYIWQCPKWHMPTWVWSLYWYCLYPFLSFAF